MVNHTNMVHQFDLKARKLVSLFMSNFKSSDGLKVRIVGKELSTLKQRYLADLRKLHAKYLDVELLETLAERFQHDMQACVQRINPQGN